MKNRASERGPQRFEAHVDDRTIDLVVEGGEVTLDGHTVPFSYERIADNRLSILIDGRSYSAVVLEDDGGVVRVHVNGRVFDVRLRTERDLLLERFGLAAAGAGGVLQVRAPMPGLVLSVAVEAGQTVEAGDGLLVLEAMKMENELSAERNGVVRAVHAGPGDAVGKNALLIELE